MAAKEDSTPKNAGSKKGNATPTTSENAKQIVGTVPAKQTDGTFLTDKTRTSLTAGPGEFNQEDVKAVWAKASEPQRAQWLVAMGSIPGLYKVGDQPPIENIKRGGIFRDQDYAALSRVLSYANASGIGIGLEKNATNAFVQSLSYLYNDSQAAIAYFGPGKKAKAIRTTSADAAAANLNNDFTSTFDSPPTEKENKEYLRKLNAAEIKAKGNLDPAIQEDILLSIIEQRATGRTKRALAGKETKPGIVETGYFGKLVRDIRSSYADNGLTIDNSRVYKNAIKGLQGQEAVANIKDNIAMSAKIQYPAFAQYIDRGKTVVEMLDPYVDVYAEAYGIPRNQVNLSDLKFVARDATKALSTEETQSYLISQPAYLKTPKYKTGVIDGLKAYAGKLKI